MKKICGMSVSVFVALVSSFVIKEKKKKDDEELERYLDSSIQ